MALATTQPLLSIPSAALGVAVTPSASAWVFSSWVELTASAPTAMVLAGFSLNGSGWSNAEFEVEFGVGSAGNEVTVARFRAAMSSAALHNSFTFPVPVTGISSGNRVTVRVRASPASATVTRVSVAYYDGGTYDSDFHTDSITEVYPATGANGVSITPANTAWTDSSWVELTSTTAEDIYLTGLQFVPAGTALAGFEIDIGTGSSGAETVIHTIRGRYSSAAGWIQNSFPMPVRVNAGTRLSVRMRKGNTAVTAWRIAAPYMLVPNTPPTTPTHTSPTSGATVGTTPALVFTSTDLEGNTIQYEVQIDIVNTFDSQ